MPASPLVEARHGASPFVLVATGAPFEATAATSLDIRLADTAGVVTWEFVCVGTDETTTTVDIVRDAPPAFSGTLAIPAGTGRALIYRSRVNGGVANGKVDPALTTTLKIYVPTADGLQVGALNETFESDDEFGTTGIINAAVRSAQSGATVPVGDDGVVAVVGGAVQNVAPATADNQLYYAPIAGSVGQFGLAPPPTGTAFFKSVDGVLDWGSGSGGTTPSFSASAIASWNQDDGEWVELQPFASPAGSDSHYAVFQTAAGAGGPAIGLPLGDLGASFAAVASGALVVVVIDDAGSPVALRDGVLVVTQIHGDATDAIVGTHHKGYASPSNARVGYSGALSAAPSADDSETISWPDGTRGIFDLVALVVTGSMQERRSRVYAVEKSGGAIVVTEIGTEVSEPPGGGIVTTIEAMAFGGDVQIYLNNTGAEDVVVDWTFEGRRMASPT